MPGFAKPIGGSSPLGDVDYFNVNDVADATFYGFRYDPITAKLTVEKINDGSVVSTPTTESLNANDYKTWVWTKSNLSFEWNSSNRTHLLTEVR